ncbi:predicted F420 dehydrogenase, beta subunit [Desulforapulum autotrophicum HRM2]|uniref:Predicted F420 dehydrogenase, beta subunit n=1 Tax=Desulforapulum autotrophicum (strain ATCC 43914 / DSM 3382 / VKM B-1955 / HRM2) TaxID=177437 RepID=C0QGX5_DESAH|nr:Coenzyme F420 hydrogenase/dehydrogenase, beta subunit C-terminal domain [Desulforapulum autotrophicum]ACN15624.1 predicted F420 dehydrogenase, beta subunit [Desulforapulum autotrophicum HRM2]
MLKNIAETKDLMERCYGCRACEQICKNNAIQIILNKEGFLYPQIDINNCIECRLCINVCPVLEHPKQENDKPLKVFAAWSKDHKRREFATSGGMFFEIAQKTIQKGGVVFGAAYDRNWNLEHSKAETLEGCVKFCGSKYAQSNTKLTYSEVKQYLEDGRFVYYTGTPCQIAGLKNFLKSDHPYLITSDIVCHGTPSNLLFKKEILWRETQKGKRIESLSYRNKDRFGWGYDCKIIWYNGKIEYEDSCNSPFFNGFWENKTLRKSCYACQFASIPRMGDITLADFWGVKKHVKRIRHTGKGVSMILVNSKKGEQLLQTLDNVEFHNSDLHTALSVQAHLSRPVKQPASRNRIYDEAYTEEYGHFARYNIVSSRIAELKRHLRNFIKRIILWKYWK